MGTIKEIIKEEHMLQRLVGCLVDPIVSVLTGLGEGGDIMGWQKERTYVW